MIRTFTVRNYAGIPDLKRIHDKILNYPYFIGDRIYSKLLSAYFEDVADYLLHCEFDFHVYISIINGAIVPRIDFAFYYKNDKSRMLKLLKIINDKFNWIVDRLVINDSEINEDNYSLYNLSKLSYPNECIIEIGIKPHSFDATKINKSFIVVDFEQYLNPIYLFHVTDRSNLNKILADGLIPKSSEKGRFIYGPMTHLLRYLNGNIARYINGKIITPKAMNIKDPILLKVGPINNLNINFLIDPSSETDGVITDSNIPSDYVKLVDDNKLAYYFKKYKLPKEGTKIKEIYL